MRDSGIDWIGEIPSSWETRKNKYIFDILKRIAGREGYDVLSVTQHGLRVKDIDSGEGQLAKDYSGYQHVYPGDFVMNHMDLLTGWVDCSELSGVTSPDYRVFRPKKSAPVVRSYYKYIFQYCYSNKVFYNLGSGVAGFGRWRLQAPAFNNFVMPLPPLSEQQRIADYLDGRCAAIDEVRHTIEDEVEALRRLRKATIHRAVTKGIDEGVPMRDSGVEWIGEIPGHWQVSRLKYVAEFYNGDRSSEYPSGSDLVEEGICFLTSNNIHGLVVDTQHVGCKHITEEKYHRLGGAKLRVNDLVFCLRGSVGNCAINKELNKGTVASSLMTIRPTRVDARFLNYQMNCQVAEYQATDAMNGSCAANLSAESVSRFRFVEPPLREQRILADYLDERCAAIDSVIDTRTRQLERLDDYRRALIFAYVTGKKEVPSHE